MKILPNYILKTVVSTTLLVVLVIAGIEMVVSLLNESDDIQTHGYGIQQAIVFVLASLPNMVYPLFPAAALMGCLMGLGKLAGQNELIVIQTSGISKFQVAAMVLRATIFMLVFATLLGEGFGPQWKQFATNYKTSALTGVSRTPQQDFWIREGKNFVYVKEALPDGTLQSILRYKFEDTHLISASSAKTGRYENKQWVFSDVTETLFLDSPTQHTQKQHYTQQTWPIALDPDFAGLMNIQPNQISLPTLYRYVHYLNKNGLYSKAYDFEFWKRILQPLTTLVMIGLAVPFIFGSLRTKPVGFRILIGIILGFGFYTFNTFLGPFSLLYQIPAFIAAIVPLLLFVLIDLILLGIFS